MFYQIKMIRKKEKPPIWRRAYVPSDITFMQMALILEELLEFPKSDLFEFEFFQERVRIVELDEEDDDLYNFTYDYLDAQDTYVNTWFEYAEWFTFRIRDGADRKDVRLPEYRVEIEKLVAEAKFPQSGESLAHPILVKQKSPDPDPYWTGFEEFNDYLKNVSFPGERQPDGVRYEEATVEGMLSAYTRQELEEIALDLGLHISTKRKSTIAYEIARHILKPEVMRESLLLVSEEELDAFESAMDRGIFLPTPEDEDLLDPLCELFYVEVFTDDAYEVPDEVRIIYEILKKQDYRGFHRKAQWLIQCLQVFDLIHAVAPVKILYQMYRRQKLEGSSYQDFLELFDKIPDDQNPCRIINGKVVSNELVFDDSYWFIERSQRDVAYYIPTKEEILEIAENGYPSSERAYRDMWLFMRDELGMEELACEFFCMDIFYNLSCGELPDDCVDRLDKEGLTFESEQQAKQFCDIFMRVNSNTRMFELRGHTPTELNLLSEFPPTAWLLNEEPVTKAKKIYPNDPCPCGSGKKYKKCCGRNA